MKLLKDKPLDLPKRESDQLIYLRQKIEEIIDFVWKVPEPHIFRKISGTINSTDEFYPYCFCHKGKT